MNTLFIRLEGPLQAWGIRARWGERDTMLEPTKSGVIGLLACALGLPRSADGPIRELNDALRCGVRVDRAGHILRDYHTVVGGVRAADGKIKMTQSIGEPETVVSNRSYLADASFLVALQGPAELIARLAGALQNPVWPPYLGRRSCPPAVPPFAGTGQHESLADALRAQVPRPAGGRVRLVLEAPPGAGSRRHDNVESQRLRRYRPRFVVEQLLELPGGPAGAAEEG